MQLSNKKELAAKVLEVGKGRIIFVESALAEIKEAITRQDILDLHKNGAILIREVRGRKRIEKRKYRRGIGKRKQRNVNTKRNYMMLTRKLRKVAKNWVDTKKITPENHQRVRTMIRASRFKSKKHLLESFKELQ